MTKSIAKNKLAKPLLYLFETNGTYAFVLFCLITYLTTYIANNFLLTNSVYENYFEQLSIENVSQIISNIDKWKWLSYISIPLFYLLKFFVISISVLIGLMLYDIKISFSKLFKIVLISEIVFLIAIVIKTLYFLLITSNFKLEEFQIYYPLSIINCLNSEKLEVWLRYPLQQLNLFEVAYIFLVASGVAISLRLNYKKSLIIVSSSYLTGLFLWVVFITFLTVKFGA